MSGQLIAQMAQPMQAFSSLKTAYLLPDEFVSSPISISFFGHTLTHIPQVLHFSLSITIFAISTC